MTELLELLKREGREISHLERVEGLAESCVSGEVSVEGDNVLETLFVGQGIFTEDEMRGYHNAKQWSALQATRRKIRDSLSREDFELDQTPGMSDEEMTALYNSAYFYIEEQVVFACASFLNAYLDVSFRDDRYNPEEFQTLLAGMFKHLSPEDKMALSAKVGSFEAYQDSYDYCCDGIKDLMLQEGFYIESYGGARFVEQFIYQLYEGQRFSDVAKLLTLLYEVLLKHKDGEDGEALRDAMRFVTHRYGTPIYGPSNAFIDYATWGIKNAGTDTFTVNLANMSIIGKGSSHLEYWKKEVPEENGVYHQPVAADATARLNGLGRSYSLDYAEQGNQHYMDVLRDKRLNPFGVSEEDLAATLGSFNHPVFRSLIERDLGIKYEDMTLRQQVWLLSFLQTHSTEVLQAMGGFLYSCTDDERVDVLDAFVACSRDPRFGDLLYRVIEMDDRILAKKVVVAYGRLMKIFQDLSEDRNWEDVEPLFAGIAKRGWEILEDPELVESESRRYEQDVARTGALIRSLVKSGSLEGIKDVEELEKQIRVDVIYGGEGLIEGGSREGMESAENYLQPEVFGVEDYHMIVRNLRRSYEGKDDGWLEYLIDQVPRDISDPQVSFVALRAGDGKLVGVCKFKPDLSEPNSYYFGTMYVDPEYQKDFLVGTYLQQLALSQIPEDAKVNATVGLYNHSLVRHIEGAGGIGTSITRESDETNVSHPLLGFAWNDPRFFETKNKQVWPVRRIADLEDYSDDNVMITVESLDPDEFSGKAQQRFNEGYVLTRVVPVPVGDMGNVHCVWEKPVHQIWMSE